MGNKTILVCGYGPGISQAVAQRFAKEGFSVALVGRTKSRVEEGASALAETGVEAKGFACDVGDASAVRQLVSDVRDALGPIAAIHWNAYSMAAGDLTTCSPEEIRSVLDVGVTGLVVAVQASLDDLSAQKGAVLVTGGGFAFYDDAVDSMIVQYSAMGLALAKAAQHKLVGILNKKLAGSDVYVGEVVVLGMVKGTAFDTGQGGLEPSAIADRFWTLHNERSPASVNFGG